MRFIQFSLIFFCLFGVSASFGDKVEETVNAALAGLRVCVSEEPYSKSIQRMYLGFDEKGAIKSGAVCRKIHAIETITGVVIIDKTETGFVLREALFPDIGKISQAEKRGQILDLLKYFKNVPFDPHAEKSAVDTVSGASRHGHQTTGIFNYMARHLALQMETPPEWAKPQK